MADSTPKVPGFWANIGSLFGSYAPAQTVLPEPYEAWTATGGIPVMDPGTPLELLTRKSAVEEIWRTQPHVRTVVDFIASNLATVPLQVFDRMGDTERRRVTASDDGTGLAEVLKTPVPGRQGGFRFWHAVVSDWLLYDFWLVAPVWAKDGGGLEGLQHIPSWRISLTTDFLNRPIRAKVYVGDKAGPGDPTELELDLSKCVFDHGYAPNAAGCTPMEALRETMAEQKEALAFRKRSFRNGLRGGGYITRPVDAPKWTDTARARFENAMRKYRTDGKDAGGLPLLDDGMKIESNPIGSLRDAQDLAARELSSVEVANLYHIPPELLGMRPGNYANVDAYRQALYRDHLGPYITAWEQAVGVQLLDQVEKFTGREFPDRYVEANLDTKLRGSFEQRAAQMQLASGGPWRTLNEVRALDNLPPVDNGDEVLRPLNMGQATQGAVDSGPVADVAPTEDAPADEPPAPAAEPKAAAHVCIKADGPDALDEDEQLVLEALARHFSRQSKAVASAIGAGGDWWDAERWDKELAADLLKMVTSMSADAAAKALADNGLDAGLYDVARTLNWLAEASALNAQAINAATYAAIADGDEDLELSERADKAFSYATEKRAADAAPTLVSFAKGFGVVESARQAAGDRATKTWSTTSSRPRASHAKLNGKTVGIDETFPNGLKWPGTTASGGKSYDETANCRCRVTVHIPDKED